MQASNIKFGTDGWRGVIADDFTFANVRRVAQATALYWRAQGGRAAIVGYDNRFLSEVYAKLVCEVFAANGITALYPPESVPTPAVSFAVRDRRLCGAVMITASHNPPLFNGYKVKADYAGPADPEICAAIERQVDAAPVQAVDFQAGVKTGQIELYDPRPAHVATVKKLIDLRAIKQARLRAVIDSMHGCGRRVLEDLLAGRDGPAFAPKAFGASAEQARARRSVETIRADRDVNFGGTNPEPIGQNLGPLCAAVKRARAHIGLATDGDADRLGVVDNAGRYVSIQIVFALLLLHLLRHRGQTGQLVVRSTNVTVLIDRIAKAYNLPVAEVPVGFKHICSKMREADVLIGGEESGGIGFQGHIPERDGILANLMLLELLTVTGKKFTRLAAELQQEFGRSVYDRIDLRYPLEKREQFIDALRNDPPTALLGQPLAEVKTFDGVKYILRDESWLMFRTSGTEPIIRIYSEASSADRVKRLLGWGKRRAVALGR